MGSSERIKIMKGNTAAGVRREGRDLGKTLLVRLLVKALHTNNRTDEGKHRGAGQKEPSLTDGR